MTRQEFKDFWMPVKIYKVTKGLKPEMSIVNIFSIESLTYEMHIRLFETYKGSQIKLTFKWSSTGMSLVYNYNNPEFDHTDCYYYCLKSDAEQALILQLERRVQEINKTVKDYTDSLNEMEDKIEQIKNSSDD